MDYNEIIGKHREMLQRVMRIKRTIGWLRLLVFLAMILIFFAAVSFERPYVAFLIVFLGVTIYIFLLKRDQVIKGKERLVKNLIAINEEELERVKLEMKGIRDGSRFSDEKHAFSGDLDLFGNHSVFQLLNRCGTWYGEEKLAEYLLQVPSKAVIEDRQKAVAELSRQTELNQELQASLRLDYKPYDSPFLSWINSTLQPARGLRIKGYSLTLFSFAFIAGVVLLSLPLSFLAIPFIINLLFALPYQKEINHIVKNLSHHYRELDRMAAGCDTVSRYQPETALLTRLYADLEGSRRAIRKLGSILHLLNSRSNIFYSLIGLLLNLDLFYLARFRNWKHQFDGHFDRWIDSLAQWEALCGLAGFHAGTAASIFPEIREESTGVQVVKLAHPLIREDKRVANNFQFTHRGHVSMITGSNMSGKSTWLRTLGVNLVLAYAGGSVVAESMAAGRMSIFTSMRTNDDLKSEASAFYAELDRIRMLLRIFEDSKLPVWFMLDELLKGTNSEDRHKGSLALIRQLHQQNGLGLVSTHDLELGKILEVEEWIESYSFNSYIKDDEIIFPYQLDEGLSRSFNATYLMRKIGIKINEDE